MKDPIDVPSLKAFLNRNAFLNRTGPLESPKKAPGLPDGAPADGNADESAVARQRSRASFVDRLAGLKRPWLDRTTVAVSVEGSSLRVVSLADQKVAGWASIPLEPRLIRNGQIADPADFGAALDETFERLNLPRHRVAWALPGFQTTARVLDLPGLRGDALRQAAVDELERTLGAAVDDSFLFSQRFEGRIRSRYVFVLAVPRSTVLTALEALEAADIRPYTMDLRPLALARAVGRADAVVVNLEEGSLDVLVVASGVTTLLRSIPLPGAATNLEAAQNRLVDEVDRALRYYDDSNPDRPLDADAALYLTGRLATGISLAERLRTMTGHPIGRLSTGLTFPADFPVAEYLVNLGLALKRS